MIFELRATAAAATTEVGTIPAPNNTRATATKHGKVRAGAINIQRHGVNRVERNKQPDVVVQTPKQSTHKNTQTSPYKASRKCCWPYANCAHANIDTDHLPRSASCTIPDRCFLVTTPLLLFKRVALNSGLPQKIIPARAPLVMFCFPKYAQSHRPRMIQAGAAQFFPTLVKSHFRLLTKVCRQRAAQPTTKQSG